MFLARLDVRSIAFIYACKKDADAHLAGLGAEVARQPADTISLLGSEFTRLRACGEFSALELQCKACNARRRVSHQNLPVEEFARRLKCWQQVCPQHADRCFGGALLSQFA